MGAAKSKLSRAATVETRRFPARPNPAVRAHRPPSHDAPQPQPTPTASSSSPAAAENAAARSDPNSPFDPAFAARLHSLGVVAPNPFLPLTQQHQTSSSRPPPPATNPALLVLRARAELQKEWDAQMEAQRRGKLEQGRRFVDVAALRQALRMREEGAEDAAIARRLALREDVMPRLGRRVKPVDVSGQGEWRVQEVVENR